MKRLVSTLEGVLVIVCFLIVRGWIAHSAVRRCYRRAA